MLFISLVIDLNLCCLFGCCGSSCSHSSGCGSNQDAGAGSTQ